MTEATRPRGYYFEEFEIGFAAESASRTITETDVMLFAGLSGDYNQLHTDAEFAKGTPFGERVAHGLLVLRPARLRVALTTVTLGGLALMSVLMCQYALGFFAEHPPEI